MLQSMELQRIRHDLVTEQQQQQISIFSYRYNKKERKGKNIFLGEGNGTPLQYSCLENPMDGGAW